MSEVVAWLGVVAPLEAAAWAAVSQGRSAHALSVIARTPCVSTVRSPSYGRNIRR